MTMCGCEFVLSGGCTVGADVRQGMRPKYLRVRESRAGLEPRVSQRDHDRNAPAARFWI